MTCCKEILGYTLANTAHQTRKSRHIVSTGWGHYSHGRKPNSSFEETVVRKLDLYTVIFSCLHIHPILPLVTFSLGPSEHTLTNELKDAMCQQITAITSEMTHQIMLIFINNLQMYITNESHRHLDDIIVKTIFK